MAAAVLSPVSIATLMPKDFSSLIASAAPVRQLSERANIPISVASENTYPRVTASFVPLPSGSETEKYEQFLKSCKSLPTKLLSNYFEMITKSTLEGSSK